MNVLPGKAVPRPLDTRTVIGNLTLTQNLIGAESVLGPLWSLPIEVQMYVALPFCFLVAIRGTTAVLRLLAAACGLYLAYRYQPHLWRASVLVFAPVFLLGVLAFAWYRQRTTPPRDLPDCVLTRAAHTVATYSYSIYLLHIPALALAFVWGRALHPAWQWVLLIGLLIALPFLAYHVIEEPGIRLGKRVSARLARRATVITPPWPHWT
jgi:peptidoglycan/LPS O-acetylase OafA/YrhL